MLRAHPRYRAPVGWSYLTPDFGAFLVRGSAVSAVLAVWKPGLTLIQLL